MPSDMPARTQRTRKRKAPARNRGRRSLLANRPSWPAIHLEPHHVDIIGLGLIAVGIFLAGVAYLRWTGGSLGGGAMRGVRLLFGAIGDAVPAGLVLGGALVLAREFRPPTRPMRTGAICLICAVTLVLAAGTLGIGPGAAPSAVLWQAHALEIRGGILGQAEFWIAGHLLSNAGADILAVFLFAAGMILVSGATLAGAIRATGAGVAGTGRVLRRSTEDLAATVARGPATVAPASAAARTRTVVDRPDPTEFEPLLPPEPDTAELIVRATHVEAPPISEDTAFDEPGPQAAEPSADESAEGFGPPPEVTAAELTPQGRYRDSVTDDPEFVWRVPGARFLTRATGEAAKPDTEGQEQVARTLVETLGHFGIEARVIGRVTGPHITRYEIRLAPGIKVGKVAQLKDDLAYALAATDIRILAPIPGKQAVGVEVPERPAADRPPR